MPVRPERLQLKGPIPNDWGADELVNLSFLLILAFTALTLVQLPADKFKQKLKQKQLILITSFSEAGPAESLGGCRKFNAMEDDVAVRMQIMVST